MKILSEQLIKEAISKQVSKRENGEAGKAEGLPLEEHRCLVTAYHQIQDLFQIHPRLKEIADKLAAHDNGVNTNPYNFPQDDEIQYS
jgi:hypothetical protein